MTPTVPSRDKSQRQGASFLEVQIAAVVMAIALAGMAPLMVLNMRQASKFREQIPSDPIHLASPEGWRPNLGVSATVNSSQSQGETTAPVEHFVADDGTGDFETEGWPWHEYGRPGYGDDFRLFYQDKWSKCGYYYLHVPPGVYDLYVTYPVYSFLSNKVEYHIHDEKHHRGKLYVDQSERHEDLAYDGKMWTRIGTYRCESGPFEIRVKNKRKRWAIADAICAIPRFNIVDLQSMQRDRMQDKISLQITSDGEITRKFKDDDDVDYDDDDDDDGDDDDDDDDDDDGFDGDLDDDKEDREAWKDESKRLKREEKAREKAQKEKEKEEKKKAKEEEKKAKEEEKEKDKD